MAWVISREVSNRARLFSRPAEAADDDAADANKDDGFNAGDNKEDARVLLPLEAVLSR